MLSRFLPFLLFAFALGACDNTPTAAPIDESPAASRPAAATSGPVGVAAGWKDFHLDVFSGQVREKWSPMVIDPSGASTASLTPAAGVPAGLLENSIKNLTALGIDRMLVVLLDSASGQITATGCLPSLSAGSSFDLYRSYQAAGMKAEIYGQTRVFGESVDVVHVSLVANASTYQAIGHRGSCSVMLGLSSIRNEESALADFHLFTEVFDIKD